MGGPSYFALFRPLNDFQSRIILFGAIFFAILAGAPLPIIGVLFARIINAFPPSEAEIRAKISQLIAAGEILHSNLQMGLIWISYCLLPRYVGMGSLLGYRGSSCL